VRNWGTGYQGLHKYKIELDHKPREINPRAPAFSNYIIFIRQVLLFTGLIDAITALGVS
jgi:hypothetical protein